MAPLARTPGVSVTARASFIVATWCDNAVEVVVVVGCGANDAGIWDKAYSG
jgi:hypothetical protein